MDNFVIKKTPFGSFALLTKGVYKVDDGYSAFKNYTGWVLFNCYNSYDECRSTLKDLMRVPCPIYGIGYRWLPGGSEWNYYLGKYAKMKLP